MRISDWSSDVCSSDLIPLIRCSEFPLIVVYLADRYSSPTAHPYRRLFILIHSQSPFSLSRRIRLTSRCGTRKIGRASCRERGCQYVWVSVVGVSVKKQKIEPLINKKTYQIKRN